MNMVYIFQLFITHNSCNYICPMSVLRMSASWKISSSRFCDPSRQYIALLCADCTPIFFWHWHKFPALRWQVEGKCVEHAAEVESPSGICTSDGEWRVKRGGCTCKPGYEPSHRQAKCKRKFLFFSFFFFVFVFSREVKSALILMENVSNRRIEW